MESFMLKRHNQHARNMSVDGLFPRVEIVVQSEKTRTNTVTEANNLVQSRPIFVCFRDF